MGDIPSYGSLFSVDYASIMLICTLLNVQLKVYMPSHFVSSRQDYSTVRKLCLKEPIADNNKALKPLLTVEVDSFRNPTATSNSF